jgi:hypothetical protein
MAMQEVGFPTPAMRSGTSCNGWLQKVDTCFLHQQQDQ